MNTTIDQSTETFNTMHKLERAGMSRTQAEITSRAIERQESMSRQELLDKIDARFDAHEALYEARFQSIENRIDAVENRIDAVEKHIDIVEKRLSWLYVESIVSICVIGAGFTGVIIALLRMG